MGRLSGSWLSPYPGRPDEQKGQAGVKGPGAPSGAGGDAGAPAGTVVLLATFNGAAFLAEQLRSLRAQTDPDWVLLARDDLSTDGTAAILDGFAAACRPGQVRRLEAGGDRLGALGNFMALLRAAPPGWRYAFCDQDDVWLPGKLARAAAALAGQPAASPALYCARQRIVDGALAGQRLSPPVRRPPSLRNALVQNIATGCTIVMNGAARDAILAAPPPATTLHDWWAYLVTTAVGGRVLFDPEPVMLYRQHAANVVGTAPGVLDRAVRAARRGPQRFMRLLLAHVEALLRHPSLTPEARGLLLDLATLPQAGRLGRLALLRRSGLYRQGLLEQAALHAWVALWQAGEAG